MSHVSATSSEEDYSSSSDSNDVTDTENSTTSSEHLNADNDNVLDDDLSALFQSRRDELAVLTDAGLEASVNASRSVHESRIASRTARPARLGRKAQEKALNIKPQTGKKKGIVPVTSALAVASHSIEMNTGPWEPEELVALRKCYDIVTTKCTGRTHDSAQRELMVEVARHVLPSRHRTAITRKLQESGFQRYVRQHRANILEQSLGMKKHVSATKRERHANELIQPRKTRMQSQLDITLGLVPGRQNGKAISRAGKKDGSKKRKSSKRRKVDVSEPVVSVQAEADRAARTSALDALLQLG